MRESWDNWTLLNGMRKITTLLFCLWALASCSQKQLDYGSVIANPNFTCKETILETYCKLRNICNSKNKVEIRLEVSYEPTIDFALYVLVNNDSGWSATKYSRSLHHSSNNTSLSIDTHNMGNPQVAEKLFDTLKENNVFGLPEQDDLKINGFVDDGSVYTLTFKVGQNFRTYHFNNPETYEEIYGKVKQFKNYLNIANAFHHAFDKNKIN